MHNKYSSHVSEQQTRDVMVIQLKLLNVLHFLVYAKIKQVSHHLNQLEERLRGLPTRKKDTKVIQLRGKIWFHLKLTRIIRSCFLQILLIIWRYCCPQFFNVIISYKLSICFLQSEYIEFQSSMYISTKNC